MALVFVLVVCSAVVLETWGAPIPILQKFEWTPGVITYGNDDRTVEDVDTADGCAVLCLQESTFICKSFDFRSKEKVCMLSKGNSYTAGVGLRLAAGADLYEVLPDYIPTEVPTTTARPTAAKPTDPTTPEGQGRDDPNAGGMKDQPSAEPISKKRGADKETDDDEDMADGKVTKARRKDREGRRKKKRGQENGEEGNGGKNGRRGRKRGRQGRRNGERKKNRRGKGRNGGNGKRTPKKTDNEVNVKSTNDVTKISVSTPRTTVPPRQTTPDPEPYQTPSPLDSDIEGGATVVAMTTQIVPSDGDVSETPNSLQDDADDDVPNVGKGNTATADAGTGDGPQVDGNKTEEEPVGKPEQGLP
ncbi:Hypp2505 [Branchiostoma lanceolatum]|uniref:Hypp2505 protein n=1 Tax=Branchiostoma lanceolatum TaxID=7740 RepID=A0A8J9ZUA6_BRALA|nr:Hypp2505 [Branchiostoma lanceolatum]